MKLVLSLAASFVLIASTAAADTVVLTDGETIEGLVRDKGDHIEVELDIGTISIERNQVKEIRRAPNSLAELRTRRAKISDKDATRLFELAEWARSNSLDSQARALCREVVLISPDHAGARSLLGERKHEGRWLSESEYMEATGHVLVRGQWLTREEAARLDAEERRARADAKERQRLAELEAQVDRARWEAAQARADAEEAQQTAKDAQSSFWWAGGYGYWPYNPYPGYPNPVPPQGQKPKPVPYGSKLSGKVQKVPGTPNLQPVKPSGPSHGTGGGRIAKPR